MSPVRGQSCWKVSAGRADSSHTSLSCFFPGSDTAGFLGCWGGPQLAGGSQRDSDWYLCLGMRLAKEG